MENSILAGIAKNILNDTEADKDHAESYAKAVKMDQANKDIAVVMAAKGPQAAAQAMIDKFTVDGKFDYAAMRDMYG